VLAGSGGKKHACVGLCDCLCDSFPVCDRATGEGCPAGLCCLDTCCPTGICYVPGNCPGRGAERRAAVADSRRRAATLSALRERRARGPCQQRRLGHEWGTTRPAGNAHMSSKPAR
jgi:hypothetical protein